MIELIQILLGYNQQSYNKNNRINNTNKFISLKNYTTEKYFLITLIKKKSKHFFNQYNLTSHYKPLTNFLNTFNLINGETSTNKQSHYSRIPLTLSSNIRYNPYSRIKNLRYHIKRIRKSYTEPYLTVLLMKPSRFILILHFSWSNRLERPKIILKLLTINQSSSRRRLHFHPRT